MITYRVIGTKSPNHVTRWHHDHSTLSDAVADYRENWTATSIWLCVGRNRKAIIIQRRVTYFGQDWAMGQKLSHILGL